ncbi:MULTISPECIES: hypothetical protein [Niastella]|uniref:Uncharacterized protein n=1 Tax=Niastella soli TaxID=2821487 RepID=A0ABS3Z537_9BACT|nr:hypothetical protein [Niastella soli]MBO9204852.1 hypothetical protein [Niastella soli]
MNVEFTKYLFSRNWKDLRIALNERKDNFRIRKPTTQQNVLLEKLETRPELIVLVDEFQSRTEMVVNVSKLRAPTLKINLFFYDGQNDRTKKVISIASGWRHYFNLSFKQIIFLLISFCCINTLIAQSKSEDEWAKIYRPQEWKATDYVALIDSIKFKPMKNMKNHSVRDIKAAILSLNSDDIRQMNITGSYYCSVKHEEMFQLWNLYFPPISKSFWNINCKGLITLMDLDGYIIKQ